MLMKRVTLRSHRTVVIVVVTALVSVLATAGAAALLGSRGDTALAATLAAPVDGTRYLAIGDSYAAGEGVRPFESGSGNATKQDGCHRSTRGYAHLLRFTSPVALDDRACSGAVIASLTTSTQTHHGVPNRYGVQLGNSPTAALGKDLGLVTISIGGNDAGFAKVLQFCAETSHCVDQPFRDGLTLRQWATQQLPGIVTRAEALYRQVRDGAPNARVVVLGYPHLFPEGRPSGGATCQLVARAYGRDERDFVRTTSSLFNTSLESAAVDAGVDFLQTKWLFAGHEECGPLGDWVNSFRAQDLGASFHPNAQGQLAYRNLISCYLQLHAPGDTAALGTDTVPGVRGSVGGSLGDDDLLSCARGTPQ